MQALNIKTLGNIQGSFSAEAAILKCIPSIFFLEIFRRFMKTSQKLALENFVLAYHATHRITLILRNLSSLVFYINSGIYICLKSKSKKIQRIPREEGWIKPDILRRLLVWPVNLNFFKSRKSFFLFKKPRDCRLSRDISGLFESVSSSIQVFLGASELLGT